MRVGIGYDIHTLRKGRRLFLGGIEVPYSKGLVAHSDGDVILHAIVDAALGATALGDIGSWFPDSDPRWKAAPSKRFVEKTRSLLNRKGWVIENIDCTLIAEAPKIGPYRDAIRKSIAALWKTSLDSVSLKAKTHEGLGEIGAGRAMACLAVVNLKKRK